MNKFLILIALVAALFLFQSCDNKEDDPVPGMKSLFVRNYANIVYSSYDDSYQTALVLQQKVDAFVANPTALALDDCKSAWKAARIPYGQTEGYRFYGGPIDGDGGVEWYLNAWPIDENFIDYVEGNANAGVINNAADYPTITEQLLLDLNKSMSETSIFTGYHAIEFLLWGQDFNTNGPGSRPYTDYLQTGGTASNQARRGTYLKVVTALLVKHLKSVRDQWVPGATYRTDFEASANIASTLGHIFNGIGELLKGELARERMLVAAESHDQENEHSCFSDNTISDIKMNFQSIKNVYYGIYTRVDGADVKGTSLEDLANELDPATAQNIESQFQDAEAKINAIPAPFDQAIVNDAEKINDAAVSLNNLSDFISELALLAKADL